MPGKSKTTWAQLKVGLLTITAMTIVGVLVFLMAGSQGFFQTKTKLFTFLRDSRAIAEGAPVTLNGVDIGGKISKVELTGSSDPARQVRLTLEVGSKFLASIPADSQTEMASANLLGTYFINIKRGMSQMPIQPGAELGSSDTAEISDLFRQSSQTLGTLQSVVDKLGLIADDVQNGKGSIGKLLVDTKAYDNFIDIEEQFKQLSSDLHKTMTSDDNSVGKLLNDKGALYDDVRSGVASIDKSLDGINKIVDGINSGKGTLGQLAQNPALHDQTLEILGDFHKLLAGIEAGQGTVGKLLKTDELSNELTATLGKVDSLIDKMSNGNGTIGRLMNDPTLFEDLDSVTRETQGLLKDFRANPKKFLHIKIGLF